MFCNQCGAKIETNGVFCTNCGARINADFENDAISKNEYDNAWGEYKPAAVSDGGVTTKSRYIYGRVARVATKEDFKRAVKEKYDTIIVTGMLALDIVRQVEKGKRNNRNSNIALVAGALIFWPALIGGAIGKALTWELKKYEVKEVGEREVIITRRV